MLLVPVVLGVAASRPSPWQLVLAGAALAGYLLSATAQSWSRARRPPAYRRPLAVYGVVFAVLGIVLVVAFPPLLLVLVIAGPAGAVVFRGARPGTRRDLVNSVAQVVQAIALIPAAAFVSGEFELGRVATFTLIGAAYLVGTVLVVRSVLRERGNEAFAGLSVGAHVAFTLAAALALPWPYALVAALLAARAAALPLIERRARRGPRPLRPVQVGIVEIVASVLVVAVSLLVAI
jgi:hypothetical protein